MVFRTLHYLMTVRDGFSTTKRTVVFWLLLECLIYVPMIFPDSSRKDRSGNLQACNDHVSSQAKQGHICLLFLDPLFNNVHVSKNEYR